MAKAKSGISSPGTTLAFLTGGIISCIRMATRYAPEAFEEINDTLSQKQIQAPSVQVSCTALLAQKLGASDTLLEQGDKLGMK